jgi:WD40 repeat protein
MAKIAEKAAANLMVLIPTEKEIKLPHHQLHVTEELLVSLYDFEPHVVHKQCSTPYAGGRKVKVNDVGDVIVYDPSESDPRKNVIKSWKSGHARSIRRIALWESPKMPQIITASGDGTLRVFDMDGKLLRKLEGGHNGKVLCVAVSQNEPYEDTTVVSGSDDKTLRFWSLKHGKSRAHCVGHEFQINAIAFCVGIGGIRLVASLDQSGEIRLWEYETGKMRRIIPTTL